MKIENQAFFKAARDKNLSAFLVIQRGGESIIRLCLNVRSKYTGQDHVEFVETPAEIRITNFKHASKINEICFHETIYYTYANHVGTFLKSIKPSSDVKFMVIANNGSTNTEAIDWTNHKLYALIDDKHTYLLSSYTGPNNIISPIK